MGGRQGPRRPPRGPRRGTLAGLCALRWSEICASKSRQQKQRLAICAQLQLTAGIRLARWVEAGDGDGGTEMQV
jgi:hypothetical protein